MNRIVREHYPVSKLPEDLRLGFEGERQVTITIERDDVRATATGVSSPEITDAAADGLSGGHFTRFKHLRRSNFGSSAEVDAHVNALRDEWVHRDR